MIKRIFAGVLCVILAFGVMCGCAGGSDKKDLEKIEAQIKEDIVGFWKEGSNYLMFFESGKAGWVDSETGKADERPYRVEGDTVIIGENKFADTMYSVEIDQNTLKYSLEDGGVQRTMIAVSKDEVLSVLEQ